MHLVVFLLAGLASLAVIALIFRSTARAIDRPLRINFLGAWGITYTFVLAQMSWVLRPWIGSWSIPYTPLRTSEGTFIEAVVRLLSP